MSVWCVSNVHVHTTVCVLGMHIRCAHSVRVRTMSSADGAGDPSLPSPAGFHRGTQPQAEKGSHLCLVFQPLPEKRKLGIFPEALLIFKRTGEGELPENLSCRWNFLKGERDQNKKPRPTQIILVGAGCPLVAPPGPNFVQAVSSSSEKQLGAAKAMCSQCPNLESKLP